VEFEDLDGGRGSDCSLHFRSRCLIESVPLWNFLFFNLHKNQVIFMYQSIHVAISPVCLVITEIFSYLRTLRITAISPAPQRAEITATMARIRVKLPSGICPVDDSAESAHLEHKSQVSSFSKICGMSLLLAPPPPVIFTKLSSLSMKLGNGGGGGKSGGLRLTDQQNESSVQPISMLLQW
jgi:hypothetical protein